MPAATMNFFTRDAPSDDAVETAEYFFFAERRQRCAGAQARGGNVRFLGASEIEIRLIEMERNDRRGLAASPADAGRGRATAAASQPPGD